VSLVVLIMMPGFKDQNSLPIAPSISIYGGHTRGSLDKYIWALASQNVFESPQGPTRAVSLRTILRPNKFVFSLTEHCVLRV
jgi:hypothetical protein